MQKKLLTKKQLNSLIEYHKSHSDSATQKYFKLTYTGYSEILSDLGLKRHPMTFGRSLSHKTILTPQLEKQIISYYTNHSNRQTHEHFHIKLKHLFEILNKNNIKHHTVTKTKKLGTIALKKTMLKKYGVENITQSDYYSKHAHKKYNYDGIFFDSSWELAIWIYAKDHAKTITKEPVKFEYYYKNKKHYYFPDFKYDGKLIEIKGDHLLTKNNTLKSAWKSDSKTKLAAKQKCMLDNKVELWPYIKVKFALDYVINNYGKTYLKSFKK